FSSAYFGVLRDRSFSRRTSRLSARVRRGRSFSRRASRISARVNAGPTFLCPRVPIFCPLFALQYVPFRSSQKFGSHPRSKLRDVRPTYRQDIEPNDLLHALAPSFQSGPFCSNEGGLRVDRIRDPTESMPEDRGHHLVWDIKLLDHPVSHRST